jgi:hypothetical protein
MKRVGLAFAAGIPLALLSGFESLGTVSIAQNRGILDEAREILSGSNDEIPSDMKLLKADETGCEGNLLASGLEGHGDVQSIARGDERVFGLKDKNVPWACLTDKTARSGTMTCPDPTTHVRITHEGDVARFECYGRGQ